MNILDLEPLELEDIKEIADLRHELALARASSDYWRAKYIEKLNRQRVMERRVSELYGPDYVNALYWFERAERSPMDECDE